MTRVPPGARRRFWGARRILLLALALLAALWFGTLEYRDLFSPDEGRYAEIPREMIASGDWITPRLNDLKYFEKPALQYWVTAAAYRLLGQEEWTARLWTATTGFLGLIATLLAGNALFGRRVGILAMLLLASTLGYALFAGVLTLDMGLTFFTTAALFGFLLAQQAHLAPGMQRRWMLAAWAAMGFAVLSKGLIGIVLPGLALLAYALLQRDGSVLRRLRPLSGLALFLVITAPWFVWVQIRNPGFFDFFFIHEHFARFALPGHHRYGPWYYFVPVLLAELLPWTLPAIASMRLAWNSRQSGAHLIHVERALVVWCVVVLLFFSLSRSKLPAYILPVLPPLALLAARHLGAGRGMRVRTALAALLAVGGAVSAFALAVLLVHPLPAGLQSTGHYAPWILAAGGAMLSAAVVGRYLAAHSRPLAGLCAAAVGAVLSYQLLLLGAQVFADRYSSETLVEEATERVGAFDAGAPFYSVQMYDQTLPLHLQRSVTLVEYEGELAFGIQAEPQKYVARLERFRALWRASSGAYAIMPLRRYRDELSHGLPMCPLARDDSTVIVARTGGRCLAP